MGKEFLVREQIEPGADFIREFNDYIPVSAACWVIPADVDNEYLYIASDEIDGGNLRKAYGEVVRILQGKTTPWFGAMRIKLINSSDPIARDLIRKLDVYAIDHPMPYRGDIIGDLAIDAGYMYPRPPVPANHSP